MGIWIVRVVALLPLTQAELQPTPFSLVPAVLTQHPPHTPSLNEKLAKPAAAKLEGDANNTRRHEIRTAWRNSAGFGTDSRSAHSLLSPLSHFESRVKSRTGLTLKPCLCTQTRPCTPSAGPGRAGPGTTCRSGPLSSSCGKQKAKSASLPREGLTELP